MGLNKTRNHERGASAGSFLPVGVSYEASSDITGSGDDHVEYVFTHQQK